MPMTRPPTVDLIPGKINKPGRSHAANVANGSYPYIFDAEEYAAIYGSTLGGLWSLNPLDLYIGGTETISIDRDFLGRQLAMRGDIGSKLWPDSTEPGFGVGVSGLFWYSGKQALRGGIVTTDAWDDVNVGFGSVAFGDTAKALGSFSVAIGNIVTAQGDQSIALGNNTIVSAGGAAIGDAIDADGADRCFGFGYRINTFGSGPATGIQCFAIGAGLSNIKRLTNVVDKSIVLGCNSEHPTVHIYPAPANGFVGKVAIGTSVSGFPIPPTATLDLLESQTDKASLRLRHGTAPTLPEDGDVWTTTAGLFAQINGVTVGPIGSGSVYGELAVTASAATTIVVPGTFVKLAGTTTLDQASFFDMPANNRLRNTGVTTKTFRVSATVTATIALVNTVVSLRLAKNGTTIANTQSRTKIGTTTESQEITIQGLIELATNDYAEVWVTGDNATTITATQMNMIATEV